MKLKQSPNTSKTKRSPRVWASTPVLVLIAVISVFLCVVVYGITKANTDNQQTSYSPGAVISGYENIAAVQKATPTPTIDPLSINKSTNSVKTKNIPYCNPNLWMDKYRLQGIQSDTPAIIYVHGGSWSSGTPHGGYGVSDVMPHVVARGYTFFAIYYRLAPGSMWPSMVEDVKCAVRSIRSRSSEFKILPDKIGLVGNSAGGQLVSLAGLADASAGFEGTGGYQGVSSRVQAVADLWGPSDLTMYQNAGSINSVITRVFGSGPLLPDILWKASPINHVSSDDPPFLIVQGDRDTTVTPDQSIRLNDALNLSGVQSTLIIVQNAEHGLVPVGILSPDQFSLNVSISDFFDSYLR